MASLLSRSLSSEKKLLEPNSVRSHLSEYLRKGEFSLLQFNKKKTKEIKELFGAARYILYLLKAILRESYRMRQREFYDSLIEVRRVVSQTM